MIKEQYATEFALARAEAKAIAKAEAKAEGYIEGKVELLIQLLEFKFGILPQNYIDKIASATSDTLDQWGIKMFRHAQSLEDVFNS